LSLSLSLSLSASFSSSLAHLPSRLSLSPLSIPDYTAMITVQEIPQITGNSKNVTGTVFEKYINFYYFDLPGDAQVFGELDNLAANFLNELYFRSRLPPTLTTYEWLLTNNSKINLENPTSPNRYVSFPSTGMVRWFVGVQGSSC